METRPWSDLGTTIPRRGNALTAFIARKLMRLLGWKMTGELPDLPKMVIAAGPHTSNWDFLVGVGAMYSAGFKVSFLGKDSLFRPPLGWIMRALGGRPVYRAGVVTDNGNHILDVHDLVIEKPLELENRINQITGVVTVGLFARRPADVLLLGTPAGVRRIDRPA